MDFFAQQAHVRRSTRFLVLLFVLAVLFIVAATDVVVVMTWLIWGHQHRLSPSVWVISSIVVVGFIALCSMYRIQSLSDGGRSVAESVGAVPVSPDTNDPQLRQLRNVIEEVAIASGLPVPDIYLMQDERGINAFAAGYSPSDAAICVTQGCIDQLSRDELQGVIAHEFSHVLNGDMRLNIRLMGLLFGIMVLAIIGRQMIWVGGGRSGRLSGGDGRQGLIALALLGIGYTGFFFGRLIQAGVARSRESLADASAVQFTRQTAGIAGALKKIAVLDDGSALQVGNRHEVAHMLFGEADDLYDPWYATHPPLRERIRILEPGFQNEELVQLAESLRSAPAAREAASADTRVTPMPAASGAAPASQLGTPVASVQPNQASVGSFVHAAALQQSIPATLTSAAQQPESALSLVLALAMSAHDDLQTQQQRTIANAFGDDLRYAVAALASQVEALSPVVRMPLVALSFPALKQLPEGRQQTLLSTLEVLVGMDSKVDLDEYCLARLLRVQLLEAMRPRRAPVDGQKKLPACRESVMSVCAVVAAYGSADDDAAARRAWLLAMDQAFPGMAPAWQTPSLDWQQPFERALDDLDGLMPAAKEIVILSLLRAIRADGVINTAETELLRVICASLHCPLPPQSGIQDN
jgi:Zn-dependent protease with chaperone function